MTFETFIETLQSDTYPEPYSEMHAAIIGEMVPKVVALCPKGASVLDVGCGQGVAVAYFETRGCEVTCITRNLADLKACWEDCIEAVECDMHHLDTMNHPEDGGYDLIWARHVLEHSPAPYYVLHEFKRIMKPGGVLYVEVPAPSTSCGHCFNKNHYSVLTFEMWASLIERAGFEVVEMGEIPLQTQAGPDTYFFYIARLK